MKTYGKSWYDVVYSILSMDHNCAYPLVFPQQKKNYMDNQKIKLQLNAMKTYPRCSMVLGHIYLHHWVIKLGFRDVGANMTQHQHVRIWAYGKSVRCAFH